MLLVRTSVIRKAELPKRFGWVWVIGGVSHIKVFSLENIYNFLLFVSDYPKKRKMFLKKVKEANNILFAIGKIC